MICYLSFGYLNFLLPSFKFKQSLTPVKYIALFLTVLKSIVLIITYPKLGRYLQGEIIDKRVFYNTTPLKPPTPIFIKKIYTSFLPQAEDQNI